MGMRTRRYAITPETTGLLSVVGVFVILLAVLFLFINKKLCFEKRGGLSCLEQGRRKQYREKSRVSEGLGLLTAVTRICVLQKSSLNYK